MIYTKRVSNFGFLATPQPRGLSIISHFILWMALLFISPLYSTEANEAKIRLLYNTLDPLSISKHLALYELYPETSFGQQALKDALRLLGSEEIPFNTLPEFKQLLNGMIELVNKQASQSCPNLSEEDLAVVQKLAAKLPHKRLKGHNIWKEAEALDLPSEEIDLARGLLLSDLGDEEQIQQQILSYEAMLDLMALQILAKLPPQPTSREKIRALNDFIFFEMGYRFPPHSQSIKDIDVYSFLPSVIDSRKGVCLGVSILYLCLSQRLALPLQIVTPPGHIFVRFQDENTIINIETTARGIHLDDEIYLSVDTRSLLTRTIKETIGMAHFNQAAVFWQQGKHEMAIKSYEKAQRYIPESLLLKELMGYNYLLNGDLEKGKALLEEVKDFIPDYAVAKETIAEDYLNGQTNIEGIQAVFMQVDENRASLLKKKEALELILKDFPNFRGGLFSLAGTWLQLHRLGEALEVLEKYHDLDDSDPTVEYYLAELYTQRINYGKAWKHLRRSEELTAQRGHKPKILKEFRQKLMQIAPE